MLTTFLCIFKKKRTFSLCLLIAADAEQPVLKSISIITVITLLIGYRSPFLAPTVSAMEHHSIVVSFILAYCNPPPSLRLP